MMAVLRIAVTLLPQAAVSVLSLNMAYNNWIYFFAGFFVRLHASVLRFMCNDYIEVLCLVGIVIYFTCDLYVVARLFPFLPIAVLISSFRKRESYEGLVNRQLAWIGKNTLYIYVFHYFFLGVISLSAIYDTLVSTHNNLAELLLILTVSLLLVYLSAYVGLILRKNNVLSVILFGHNLTDNFYRKNGKFTKQS